MAGIYDNFWEMQEGGPYDGENSNKIFKCTCCGGETFHEDGWDGAPDLSRCHKDCPCRATDWSPGRSEP